MCGEICEEASIQFHTTCFKCFAKYGIAFKDPDAFHDSGRQLSRAKGDLVPQQQIIAHAEDSVHEAAPVEAGAGDTATLLEIDMYKVGVKDSAVVKLDKKNKRKEFIKTLTLSHCTIEKDADGGDVCQLVSIGAVPLSKLLLNDLMLFCSTNKISGYRQKKKEEVALLIAAKVASDNIYASIGRLGMTMERDGPVAAGGAGVAGKKRAYRSKLVRPKAVTKTGSYFRAISLWFSAQNRHLVLATGKKMNRAELDVGGYCHKSIWDNFADQFNNNTGVSTGEEGQNAEDNSYLDVIQAPHLLYRGENPEDFDQLDGQDLAQFIRWITNQYYVVHKSVSGDHARFEDKVGEKAYLLYFHNMISSTGAENMESFMKAELRSDVFAESSIDGSIAIADRDEDMEDETTASQERHTSKRTRRLGGPPSSGAKERTDEAILKFINQQLMEDKNDASGKEETTAAGAVTSSAKEEYIREKKRIAVRADDVAMAREVSDAVDLSLQKWKAALKDIQDMKDGGIPANHAIFIATKATADLHESAFNTCLARATKRQQEEGLAVSGVQVLTAMGDATSSVTHTPAFSNTNAVVYHTPRSTGDLLFRSRSWSSDDDNDEEKE